MNPLSPLLAWRDDLCRATAFLTRLPLGKGSAQGTETAPSQADLARSLRAYPLVGLGLGLLGALVYALAAWLGLPPWPAAFLALGALLLASGALHEDGLADVADSLGARGGVEARLAVLRDSRIGSFGVLALLLALGLKASVLAALADPWSVAVALLASQAASRGFLPLALHWGAPARSDGLAAAIGRPPAAVALTALAIAGLLLLLLLGFGPAFLAVLLLVAGVAGGLRLAATLYGGYTGDVLGALQQAAEILILLICVAVIA